MTYDYCYISYIVMPSDAKINFLTGAGPEAHWPDGWSAATENLC